MNMTMLLPAGLVAKLLLKRYQLLCETVLAASCCFTLNRQPCKNPRVMRLSRQNLRNEPPKSSTIKDEKKTQGICDNFAKT